MIAVLIYVSVFFFVSAVLVVGAVRVLFPAEAAIAAKPLLLWSHRCWRCISWVSAPRAPFSVFRREPVFVDLQNYQQTFSRIRSIAPHLDINRTIDISAYLEVSEVDVEDWRSVRVNFDGDTLLQQLDSYMLAVRGDKLQPKSRRSAPRTSKASPYENYEEAFV